MSGSSGVFDCPQCGARLSIERPVDQSIRHSVIAWDDSPQSESAAHPYGKYPKGAVDAAIDALELAYSYLREKPHAEAKLNEALDRLYRYREIETGVPHPYREARSV